MNKTLFTLLALFIGSMDISQYVGGLAEDGRGPDEMDEDQGGEVKTYVVRTEEEFLSALGNNHTVVVAKDTHLNLSGLYYHLLIL